jgi:hypothetical protein
MHLFRILRMRLERRRALPDAVRHLRRNSRVGAAYDRMVDAGALSGADMALLCDRLGGEAVLRLPGGPVGAAVCTLEGERVRATAAGGLLRFATRRGRSYIITPGR